MRMKRLLVCLVFTAFSAGGLKAQDSDTLLGELFRRNIGTREQMYEQFPPHRIIGNVNYVGTESLASFLVTTPDQPVLFVVQLTRRERR